MVDNVNPRMTANEFLQLPETTQPTELINGVWTIAPSPVSNHQRLTFRIAKLLDESSQSGEVMIAPMDVYLDEENIFQPDVFWLADDSQCEERDGYFHGAPELVVEVHSPATAKTDKQTKFTACEKHGVIAYWMADPAGHILEVWQRKDSKFQRTGVYGEGDTFSSSALKTQVALSGIFPDTGEKSS
jgi:Uma2 family endonuclease